MRLQAVAAGYRAAAAKRDGPSLLSSAVDAAVASLDGKDEKTIRAAVELVHSRYQAVEKVFD